MAPRTKVVAPNVASTQRPANHTALTLMRAASFGIFAGVRSSSKILPKRKVKPPPVRRGFEVNDYSKYGIVAGSLPQASARYLPPSFFMVPSSIIDWMILSMVAPLVEPFS